MCAGNNAIPASPLIVWSRLALGRVVASDPSALGLDDSVLIPILDGWIARLGHMVANSPMTDDNWVAYRNFLKMILTTIYAGIGDADESHDVDR